MASRKAQSRAAETPLPVKTGRQKDWHRHGLALGALWTLALAAYASSFGAGMVFDNRFAILNDPRLRAATLHNAGLILTRDYWFGNWSSNLYRPLTTLTYLFNYAVLGNGADPAGYHLVNFALHAVNIALVYVLIFWILGELRLAVAAAAIWAVHPVLTESVTNIVGRADLLAALGVLTALVCHIQAGRSGGSRGLRWLPALALATALGIFSKESAIAVLGVMAIYDLAFAPQVAWRSRIPNYVAAALPCLLFLYVRGGVLAASPALPVPFTDNPLNGANFWTARLTALKVIGKYVGLLLWPGSLSADYSYNQVPLFRASDIASVAGVAVSGALVAAGIWTFRRHKAIFFFVMLFFVTLAPVSNVFLLIGTVMAERFLYLPAIAFAGCVALGLRAASRRMPGKAAPTVFAAICLAFAVRTYVRNQDWATEESLMASSMAAAPDSYKPHSFMATYLSGSAAVAEADRTRAILDPLPDERNNLRAYTSVGIGYRKEGYRVAAQNPQEAQSWYRKSLDALLRAQAIERAVDRLNQRESAQDSKGKLSFEWDKVYIELGRTYLGLSQPQEALDAFEKGRHLSPHPEYFFEEISNAYRALGKDRQAAIALIGAVMINAGQSQSTPEAVNSYQTQLSAKLMELYRQSAPQSCAVRETRGMRTIDMECPMVKDDVCAAFREVSREYPTQGAPAGCAAQ